MFDEIPTFKFVNRFRTRLQVVIEDQSDRINMLKMSSNSKQNVPLSENALLNKKF